jgi:hypothetical protein
MSKRHHAAAVIRALLQQRRLCTTKATQEASGRRVQRLDENFVDRHMGRLRQRPHHCNRNVACVQPHVPVLAALRELRARLLVGGAGGDAAVRVARLHARDLDAAARALLAQALAEPLHKELGTGVPVAR